MNTPVSISNIHIFLVVIIIRYLIQYVWLFIWWHRIRQGSKGYDIAIIEIGGTAGDIEAMPFMEAVRQMRVELGFQGSLLMHLTLVPYIASAGETKTKPTQHSVKELRSIGLLPDILICRSDHTIPEESRQKIANSTNVESRAVILAEDAQSIYQIPRKFS